MDSDEFDEFDLHEIEAALYAKIHHEVYNEEEPKKEELHSSLNISAISVDDDTPALAECLKPPESINADISIDVDVDSKYSVGKCSKKKPRIADVSDYSDEEVVVVETIPGDVTVISDSDSDIECISQPTNIEHVVMLVKESLKEPKIPKVHTETKKAVVSSVYKKLEDDPLTPGQLKYLNVHYRCDGDGNEVVSPKNKRTRFTSSGEEEEVFSEREIKSLKANLSFNFIDNNRNHTGSHREVLAKIEDIVRQSTVPGIEYSARVPRVWSAKMEAFYDGQEDIPDYEKMCKNLSGGGKLWAVDSVDKYGSRGRGRYFTNQKGRCNNCNQIGHFARECPDPVKPIVCSMCGEQGHQHFRCRFAMCLQCGGKTREFQELCSSCRYEFKHKCKICKLSGHMAARCPDVWRRYHLSVTAEGADKPEEPQKPLMVKHSGCCNCASRHHLVSSCPGKRENLLPVHTPHIIYSYSDPIEHFNPSVQRFAQIHPDALEPGYALDRGSACVHFTMKKCGGKTLQDYIFEEVEEIWPKVKLAPCPKARVGGKGLKNVLHIFGNSEAEQTEVKDYLNNAFEFIKSRKFLDGKKAILTSAKNHLKKRRSELMISPGVCRQSGFWTKMASKLAEKAKRSAEGSKKAAQKSQNTDVKPAKKRKSYKDKQDKLENKKKSRLARKAERIIRRHGLDIEI